MKTPKFFTPRFEPQTAQRFHRIIKQQTSQVLGDDQALKVTSVVSATGTSIKFKLIGRAVVQQEFGSLTKPAKPWISRMLNQAAPLLSRTFVVAMKTKYRKK